MLALVRDGLQSFLMIATNALQPCCFVHMHHQASPSPFHPGTIDDTIWPLVHRKLDVVGSTLDGNLLRTATGLNITCEAFVEWVPGMMGEGGEEPAVKQEQASVIKQEPGPQLVTPAAKERPRWSLLPNRMSGTI